MKNKITVNIFSDSIYFPNGWFGGIHTAFLNNIRLLETISDKVDYRINSFRKADIYHIHTLGPFSPLIFSLRRPTIATAHVIPKSLLGTTRGYFYWKSLWEKYSQFFYNHPDLILAVSPTVKTELRKYNITTPIHILSNPIDTSMFFKSKQLRLQGRKMLGLSTCDVIILSTGFIQTRKGINDFLHVAESLPEYKFVWVGAIPFGIVSDAIFDTTIPPNVILTGFIPYEKIPFYYNAADIFFFPSFQENASMAILEAAATGLPLVLRNLGEYKSLYKTGYLTGETQNEFIYTLRKLTSDKKLLENYSAHSLTISQQFSFSVLAEKLYKTYLSMIEDTQLANYQHSKVV